ncbi:metal ABC transporter permease [Treponema phagedenis]|uniref:Metal ABC transporter permease n=1 Tax=Treponema phagedenis TaxID=162 RepID=A0A0B7GT43_TREPH|nr:metal ABC transporter permease [Treponema phagedenis]EFW36918.1 ABC 3 transport family protein [Treponema phagedenis F0421]NVP23011.1 metal ABC transporter permease [Treponema phagedenis]QEJ95131.1 metal ABC transporter permease [Treponema phagedenis]QEJ98198.1 metal ABC transporter permease [Treponema phagedenis]QEK01055.1 metal ABC transporter permease [Treponema phagedenis]
MLQYTFMQNAFIVSFFIAILCPLIGIYLVLRRYSMIGDTLAHGSLAGVTLALASGLNPILGAFVFTSLAGALIEALRSFFKQYTDLILSIVLSLSVGIAITIMSSGLIRANAESYLFGSVLTVSEADVLTVIVLSILSLIAVFILYHEMLYITLDEDIARVIGIRVKLINYVFSILVAASIAVSIKIVGMLVLSSMIALPVATALQLKQGFKRTIIFSFVFSIIDIMAGLIFSYYLNVAPGGFTALVSVIVLVCVILIKKLLR